MRVDHTPIDRSRTQERAAAPEVNLRSRVNLMRLRHKLAGEAPGAPAEGGAAATTPDQFAPTKGAGRDNGVHGDPDLHAARLRWAHSHNEKHDTVELSGSKARAHRGDDSGQPNLLDARLRYEQAQAAAELASPKDDAEKLDVVEVDLRDPVTTFRLRHQAAEDAARPEATAVSATTPERADATRARLERVDRTA